MEVPAAIISNVRPHGETLTIVSVIHNGEQYEVVANLQEDGTPRWKEGEVCIYVPENAIVPEDVLKERGYWNEEKNKGLLGGSKGNRVKMQRFAGFESRGLIFKVEDDGQGNYTVHGADGTYDFVKLGDDVATHLGITEYVPQ